MKTPDGKKLAMTRSNSGSMSFDQLKKFIGVDTQDESLVQESGDATNPGEGHEEGNRANPDGNVKNSQSYR